MRAWLARETGTRTAPLVGAIVYMAAPYHLLDLYVRGAFAEFAGYAVLPLLMLAIRRLADRPRAAPVLLAVAYAALLLTHLPTALLISVAVIPPYVLFRAWRMGERRLAAIFLLRAAAGGVLGIGLRRFTWCRRSRCRTLFRRTSSGRRFSRPRIGCC